MSTQGCYQSASVGERAAKKTDYGNCSGRTANAMRSSSDLSLLGAPVFEDSPSSGHDHARGVFVHL